MNISQANIKDIDKVLSIINETNRKYYKSIIKPEYFKEPVLNLDQIQNLREKKKKILSKAEKLRNDIIKILKMNQQIPLFKISNCPYLKVMNPDIQKKSNDK